MNSVGGGGGKGVFGRLADALVDILQSAGIGPIAKWVDDFCFIRVSQDALAVYDAYRVRYRRAIQAWGGEVRERARNFYPGRHLLGGAQEEFDDDMVFPLKDFSAVPGWHAEDESFAYSHRDIDAITSPFGVA